MYVYPYGDSQQLNLDWIINKLKELEDRKASAADLEEIANVFIALTHSSGTQYRRYDYCYYQDKLYRALNDNIGAFNASDWLEVRLGDDIPVLTRLINAIDAAAVVDVKFDTSGTNGILQQKYNNAYHDVVEVDYTPVQNSKRPLSSNAGYDLNGAITSGTLLNGMPQTAMRIPANADLDSYTTAGTYYIYSDADAGTIANTPRNASCTLYVINRANANYKAQVYIPTSGVYVYFVRIYNGSSWSNWETILNTNNNIAKVEYGNSATKHYSVGEWLVLGNGSLYKAIAEIQNGDSLAIGANISSAPTTVSDLIAQLAYNVEFGEWTPHIYDLNTYKRATPHTGLYFHIGKLWVLAYETFDGGVTCDLSEISTMLQIRNFPVSGINIIGGLFDIDQVATVNNHYVQAAIENRIYFRPNVLSTAFTDATKVKFSFIAFGIKT